MGYNSLNKIYQEKREIALYIQRENTSLYTKEILEDSLSVIFLDLLRQPGQHSPEWMWLQVFTSIDQHFVEDP